MKMKLSFTTLGCPEWSFEKILYEAKRLGFDAIEVRGIEGKMNADEIECFFKENQAKTEEMLKAHNLKICGFGSTVKFHDKGSFEQNITDGKKAIDICSDMKIPFIRVFGDAIPDKENKMQTIAAVVDGLRQLCEYARGKNVNILLEIHGEFNTIEVLSRVIEGLKGCPEFGILWDIEHTDREYKDDFMPVYELIKPYIKHTHIKDYIRGENGAFKLCLIGEGDIPIKDIVKQLKLDGYDGYYSLEWEKKWVPELPEPEIAYPAYAEYMRAL